MTFGERSAHRQSLRLCHGMGRICCRYFSVFYTRILIADSRIEEQQKNARINAPHDSNMCVAGAILPAKIQPLAWNLLERFIVIPAGEARECA